MRMGEDDDCGVSQCSLLAREVLLSSTLHNLLYIGDARPWKNSLSCFSLGNIFSPFRPLVGLFPQAMPTGRSRSGMGL